MIGSNHFNHSQERLHCDYVTNILQTELILGIPDQDISYNLSSMFSQSYRHYSTCSIRAVATSILHREVLLYLIIIQFIYSVINGYDEITRKIIFLFIYIYIMVHILFTLFTTTSNYYIHVTLSNHQ